MTTTDEPGLRTRAPTRPPDRLTTAAETVGPQGRLVQERVIVRTGQWPDHP